MHRRRAIAALFAAVSSPAMAQPAEPIVLPENTLLVVAPLQEITSIDMKEGDVHTLMVANEVTQDGAVVIPRGSPVKATITWRTGKGIVGKSAKFELTFNSVKAGRKNWALRGNTAGALLGAAIITGRSAVLMPGTLINVFTAEEIVLEPRRSAGKPDVQQPAGQPARTSNKRSRVRCDTCRY